MTSRFWAGVHGLCDDTTTAFELKSVTIVDGC